MLALFSLTITVSAFLLFLIQPMIAKLIMPYLGGAPTVWNTAMLFFQACLLCGYAYAHAGAKWLAPKPHMALHAVLVLASLSLLPLSLFVPELDAAHQPIGWTLSALAFTVGLPFLMLSSSAPLLQHWFAQSGHRLAHNPYPLYSASNAGSLTALFAFPLMVEPFLSSRWQTDGWSLGYALYLLLLFGCMAAVWRRAPLRVAHVDAVTGAKVSLRQMGHWVLLAAIPSSLMLGVTSYISTDIAAVPLLWIIPLALYLLSFIFAFAGGRGDLYEACRKIYLPILALMLILTLSSAGFDLGIFAAHLFGFFVAAMVCHGQLNLRKPHASRLTSFYLCMALGGVLGGIFNGLIAPVLLNDVIEYRLVLIAAALLYPAYQSQALTKRAAMLLAGFALLLLLYYAADEWLRERALHQMIAGSGQARGLDWLIYLSLVGSGLYLLRRTRLGFVAALAMIYAGNLVWERDPMLLRERNFFGVSRVAVNDEKRINEYYHGTTLHGIQSLDEELRLKPVAYYGALKEVIDSVGGEARHEDFAVLGLGMGTVQCYATPNQHFDYFEIDPIVWQIAKDTRYFTYLRDCPGSHAVYLGDGRIEIAKMDDAKYRMIVLDAYSSDSLPIHLITRDAVALYQQKLKAGGILAFNISNRHMNLRPILANIAGDLNMGIRVKGFEPDHPLAYAAIWVVMSSDEALLETMSAQHAGWQTPPRSDMRTWRDDYSNILQALTLTQGWFTQAGNNGK